VSPWCPSSTGTLSCCSLFPFHMPTCVPYPAACSDLSSCGSPAYSYMPSSLLHITGYAGYLGLPPQVFIQHKPHDFMPYRNICRVSCLTKGLVDLKCIWISFKILSAHLHLKFAAKRRLGTGTQPVSMRGTAASPLAAVTACCVQRYG